MRSIKDLAYKGTNSSFDMLHTTTPRMTLFSFKPVLRSDNVTRFRVNSPSGLSADNFWKCPRCFSGLIFCKKRQTWNWEYMRLFQWNWPLLLQKFEVFYFSLFLFVWWDPEYYSNTLINGPAAVLEFPIEDRTNELYRSFLKRFHILLEISKPKKLNLVCNLK